MTDSGKGDLRTIVNGLFPTNFDTASLSKRGKDEIKEAIDAILRISSYQDARLTLALEQLDKAADEITRLNTLIDSMKASR